MSRSTISKGPLGLEICNERMSPLYIGSFLNREVTK
jgi:hypothetical protein